MKNVVKEKHYYASGWTFLLFVVIDTTTITFLDKLPLVLVCLTILSYVAFALIACFLLLRGEGEP